MRLLDLALQIDRIGQAIVEYEDDVAADFLRQVNLGLVHRRSFKDNEFERALFCTAWWGIPRRRERLTPRCAASAVGRHRRSARPRPRRRSKSPDSTRNRRD